MPRNRSAGRAAPARPRAPAPAPPPQQHRPATTMAAPPSAAAPPQMAPPAQAQGPGLFGQMASTAAGVAIGSSIGNAVGSFFSGGSAEPAAQQPVQAQAPQQQQYGNGCEAAAQQFTKCLNENGNNMQICNWYLEQLNACQAAAANSSSTSF